MVWTNGLIGWLIEWRELWHDRRVSCDVIGQNRVTWCAAESHVVLLYMSDVYTVQYWQEGGTFGREPRDHNS